MHSLRPLLGGLNHSGALRSVSLRTLWWHATRGADRGLKCHGRAAERAEDQSMDDSPSVALTIDGNDWPYGLLSTGGLASLRLVDQPVETTFPEYADMARR